MGLDSAFWKQERARREQHQANEKVWHVAHEKSMVYDFEVGVRCKVASKTAARSLVRMGRTIKQSWDTIEQYRYLMDKKPLRTNINKPVVAPQQAQETATALPVITEDNNKQPRV